MAEEKVPEDIKKKVNDGWIRSWMMIEVLAVTEKAAKSALEKHIQKMGREKRTIIYNKKFHEIKKVEKPLPKIEAAYSYVAELELVTQAYDQLIYLVMNYGPSSIEILEPEKLKIDMGEAQSILNSVAEMIHKFVAAGIGGLIINT
jgi:hypothetical protein